MNSIFWPRRKHHLIKALELAEPRTLSPQLRASLKGTLMLVNTIRDLERASLSDSGLAKGIKVSIAEHLAVASAAVTDQASKEGLGLIAEGLMGAEERKATGPLLAGLNETELVGYVGPLTTWLGKSREVFFSGFFGTPNRSLQAVSDVIDTHFIDSVSRLSDALGVTLQTVPGCAYKIIDLFGIAGEADTFPKHFAYFMPEDQGVKYASVKRTVVFANTYLALFQHIAYGQRNIFGWSEENLPAWHDVGRYLIAWFRGHDLGHSVVIEGTDYRALSKHDRWGSMVAQEAVADVFGFLLSMDSEIAGELELDTMKMVRLYVLELFRYLRRGPAEFPDAGSAYVQLRLLEEAGVLSVRSAGEIHIDCERFVGAMKCIAEELVTSVLAGNIDSFAAFLKAYSPHLVEDGRDLLFGLDTCVTSLFYEQSLMETV